MAYPSQSDAVLFPQGIRKRNRRRPRRLVRATDAGYSRGGGRAVAGERWETLPGRLRPAAKSCGSLDHRSRRRARENARPAESKAQYARNRYHLARELLRRTRLKTDGRHRFQLIYAGAAQSLHDREE